jgi:hypothetical protein
VLQSQLVCNSVYFLKFIIHEMNSEMVKFRMLVLTEREKSDVTDTDVAMI